MQDPYQHVGTSQEGSLIRQGSYMPTGISNQAMMALRQQMDHSNHDMVNLLSTQMHNIMTPLYELINKIGDKLGNGTPSRAMSVNLNDTENPGGHGNLQNIVRPNRNPNDNLDQMVERILNRHGFDVGRNERPYFVSAFPDYITQVELPRGVKVPKFSKFAGELTESTVEHIARYGVECGDLANNEYLKMKYFPSSLTKHAFTWFTTLPPNSIHTWVQLEGSFHEHFFREETKVSIVDLMNIKRQSNETLDDYLNRFRQLKSRCYTNIPEHELVRIAATGLDFSIRKKLVNEQLRDMAQLAEKVRRIEQIKLEKEKLMKFDKFVRKEKIAYLESSELNEDSNYEVVSEDFEINLAELRPGPTYQCQMLKPGGNIEGNSTKKYSFDVSKAEKIFDTLLKDKQIILPENHKIPPFEQRKGKKFCKYHNMYGHWTNSCVRFRDFIEKAITDGRLAFEEKEMKVDVDPFAAHTGYVEPVSMSINMVEVAAEDDDSIEPISDEKLEELMEDFAKEQEPIYPKEGDSLVEFLSKKKEADKEVMLCPRCSAVFDRAAAKAFEESEIMKNYKAEKLREKMKPNARSNAGLTMRQVHMPQYNAPVGKMEMYNSSRFGNTFVPNANVPVGRWNAPPRPMMGRGKQVMTSMGNPVQRNEGKFSNLTTGNVRIPGRRQQRMRKATFDGFGGNSFSISVPKKWESSRKFIEDNEDMITDCFESGFEDSLEDICGIVSILATEYAGAMEAVNEQEDIHREDYFEDPNYESKVIWVNHISRVVPKFNSAVFDSPTEEMKGHLKPLLLTLMIEGQEVNKVLVDGGAAVNILPKTMLKRLGKSLTDLKPHNIMISDYAGKSSNPEGMILLDVQIGSVKRTTMFIVTPSKANFNVLLGREWIHGVGAVPSTVHQKIFFWNDDEGLEVLEVDQKTYEVGMYFADQQLTAFSKTKPFDACNSGVMDEEEGVKKTFCWDVKRGFVIRAEKNSAPLDE
uniref:Retrotransposon gag domain-containing protein n=1 Tax=Cajanus cajan TaxID=3821 RepID=A0A151TV51_CAJCA|nr:hypothetical protein KK1_010146 [Cajanus cajan]